MDTGKLSGKAVLYVTEGSGNSFKPALALHQLSRTYALAFVDVVGGETRLPGFTAINKAARVPFLVGADGFGVSESNAIAWYVAEDSPLMPTRADDRAEVLQWMFFEQTRLEPNISPARFYTTILPHREAEFAADIPVWRTKATEGLRLLDDHLFTSRFIAKRHGYSVGDIAVFGYVHLAGQAGIDLGAFRSVSRWIKRVEATPRFLPIGELLGPSSAHVRAHRDDRSLANLSPARRLAGG